MIDGDGSSDTSSGRVGVVCIDELRMACITAFGDDPDVTLRFEDAETTLVASGSSAEPSDEVWVTLQPFPDMAARLRSQQRLSDDVRTVEKIASSPLTLVVASERADALVATCGDPVDWTCLGDAAGDAWSRLDPEQRAGSVRPAFAPHPATAIGQLGVTGAVLGFFDGAPIDGSDPDLLTWSRRLDRATNRSAVSGSTAVSVIQTRPSALDIAVGATAELTTADDPRFALVAPSPAVTVEVVASVPSGVELPGGFVTDLRESLTAAGWEPPRNGAPSVSVDDMLNVRRIWEQLT